MAKRLDGLDQALGRLVFRAFGTLCAAVAIACLYLAYRYLTDWYEGSMATTVVFAIVGIGFGAVVPYAFSRRRRLTEALDAMQDPVPDMTRRPKR